MKLRHFLDAAFAIFVEEYQRIGGMGILEALEHMAEWGQGDGTKPAPTAGGKTTDQLAALRKMAFG